MTEYMHWNDPRNPDCLPSVPPPDAATRVSPVELALSARYIPYYRGASGNILYCRGLCVYAWPSREGTYGCAPGYQYAERRGQGQHDKFTSLEKLLEHPWLQREMPKPENFIGEGWA